MIEQDAFRTSVISVRSINSFSSSSYCIFFKSVALSDEGNHPKG